MVSQTRKRATIQDQEASMDEEVVPHKQRKKRKTREENAVAAGVKRPRSQRGLLRKLVEMPMDILYEIFGQLDPLDLVHMARTTKAFRAILMSRSSKLIWKSARSNIYGLPECPDDLTEPQYAVLMFVTRCSFCQRDLAVVHISFYARVRCCNRCMKTHFPNRYHDSNPSSTFGPTLLNRWLPGIVVPRIDKNSNRGENRIVHVAFIWDKIQNQWNSEYKALQNPHDQYAWQLHKLKLQYAIQEHASACALWHEARKNNASTEYMDQILESKAILINYLNAIGLEGEIYKEISSMHDSMNPLQKWIDKLLPLEERESSEMATLLKGLVEDTLKVLKESRERRESTVFFQIRKRFLSGIYEAGIKSLPFNEPRPSLAQVYRIAEVHDLIDYSAPASTALRVPFDELVVLWKMHVDGKLSNIIKDAYKLDCNIDPATVFDLAVAIFYCSTCIEVLNHDQARVHSCQPRDRYISRGSSGFTSAFGYALWYDVDGAIEVSSRSATMAQTLIALCDRDPMVTTAREMDELDPIFECQDCNSPNEGRLTMTWSASYLHEQTSHRHDTNRLGLSLLEEETASKVRERIREELARQTYAGTYSYSPVKYNSFVCLPCREIINGISSYRNHLKSKHNTSKVEYEKLIFPFDNRRCPPTFRLWPPREES